MITPLLVTLALAVPLVLVLLLAPALLVARFFAGPEDEEEDWVDLLPQVSPLGFDVQRPTSGRTRLYHGCPAQELDGQKHGHVSH